MAGRRLVAGAVVLLVAAPIGWYLASFERRIATHVATMDRILASMRQRGDNHTTAGADRIGMPVYYVNMDENADRRARIEQRLAELRPPVIGTRVRGIDGRRLFASAEVHSGFEWNSAAELGCTLSHLAVARRLAEDGHAAALVIEDDAHFGLVPLWPVSLPELVSALPSEWTSLLLYHGTGARHEPPRRGHTALVPYDTTGRVRSPGTVAYVLSRRGALELLRLTDDGTTVHAVKLGTRDGHADTVMYEFPGALPFIAWPRYVLPYNDLVQATSTIHSGNSKHHLWHVRVAVAVLQRAVDEWTNRASPASAVRRE